jgi:hypothetical protein
MGQQQLLLIILGVIIVGIAIAVGLQLFQAGSVGANQDALQNDVMNIAAHAQQYFVRPESMGGGNGSFDGYIAAFPERLATTGNGTYEVTAAAGNTVTIVGESTPYPGSTVQLVYTRGVGNAEDTYTWTFVGLFE